MKSWKHKYSLCFSSFMHHEKLNLRFYSSNIVCKQYWSSEHICLELNVWMLRLLYIRSSRVEVSCKEGVLKIKILQNSLENIHDAVSNKISG